MNNIIDPTPKTTEIGIRIQIEVRRPVARLTTRNIDHWIEEFSLLLKTDRNFDVTDIESHKKSREILIMAKKCNTTSIEVENRAENKRRVIEFTIWFGKIEDFRNFSEKM